MKTDQRLGLIRYNIDKEPHIKIEKTKCAYLACENKPCINGCPAGCFTLENNRLHYQYEDCIECGTCKIVCPYDAIDWNYPRGRFGISYKYG
jgi:ferredoxin like protein